MVLGVKAPGPSYGNTPAHVFSVFLQALNEMLENVGIPLEIIDGFISSISVAVPWTSLLNESCQIEVSGMELTFSPKQKVDQWNAGKRLFLEDSKQSLKHSKELFDY